jgi:hypothetical protein
VPIEIPITITISDEGLVAIAEALGLAAPEPLAQADPPRAPQTDAPELPSEWTHIEDRPDESYRWPNRTESEAYSPFSVYEGKTSAGSIRLAIGRCTREPVWGEDRAYMVTFHVTKAGGKYPLCEFLADDEGEFVSVIKGNGERKRSLYGADEQLPVGYEGLPTAMYAERVHAKGVWRKQVVVAAEDDVATMLAHTLIQGNLRFNIRPS